MKKDKNYISKILVPKFADNMPNYPYRIYGMYDWNGKRWVLNKEFCAQHNIDVSKN